MLRIRMADSPAPNARSCGGSGASSCSGRRRRLASSASLFLRLKREEAARAALAAEVAAFGPRFEQFKDAVRDVNRQLTSNVFHQVDLADRGLAADRRAASTSSNLGDGRRQGDAHRRQDRQPDVGGARDRAVFGAHRREAGDVHAAQGAARRSRSRSRSRCPTSPRARRRRRSSRWRARPSTSPARRPASARAATRRHRQTTKMRTLDSHTLPR